ncbi:hypothetical protein Tco_1147040 [Tanacetum coccineum]
MVQQTIMKNLYLKHGLVSRTYTKNGKLHDLNAEESWALLEDLALYDNESWNDPRDFAKPVKAIALPQDVPSTSDRRLIELENQVQRLMEAHLALTQPTQVNKITTSCEIYNGPYDTQYCMEDLERAFVEYASLCTDKARDARLSKFKSDFKQQQGEMTNKIDTMLKAITDQIAGALPSDTVKNPKLGTHPVSSTRSYPTEDPQCPAYIHSSTNTITIHPKQPKESQDDGKVMFIEIIRDDEPQCKDSNEGEGATTEGLSVEYFDIFPTRDELTYHRFINGNDEVAYKMPHKIEQYNSLSNLEKEHTKLVYLRNEEDNRRDVEYVMSMILGFYKECLELGPEYLTGVEDEGEVTLYLMRRSLEVLRKFHWMILEGRFNQLSHVSSPLLSKPGEY